MTERTFHLQRPSREAAETIRIYADRVAKGEENAQSVAQIAVALGFMLIGTTVSKKVHYPVSERQHRFGDLLDVDKGFSMIPEAVGKKSLRAGYQSEVAVLTGIFGDLNDIKQRHARARELGLTPGMPESRLGWGYSSQKSRSVGFIPQEDACVITHASAPLITAAEDTSSPLLGCIDLIYPHPQSVRIAHDAGQYLLPVPRRTVATLRLVSTLDLPLDIVPTVYNSVWQAA